MFQLLKKKSAIFKDKKNPKQLFVNVKITFKGNLLKKINIYKLFEKVLLFQKIKPKHLLETQVKVKKVKTLSFPVKNITLC